MLNGYSQSLPTKNEQYDFLKWYLKANTLDSLSVNLDRFDSDLDDINDPLFRTTRDSLNISRTDISFIKTQIKKNKKQIFLATSSLKDVSFKKSEDEFLPVTNISLPVFSVDRTIALINVNYHCGSLCGHGGIEVYRKVGGKWQRFIMKFWASWMS